MFKSHRLLNAALGGCLATFLLVAAASAQKSEPVAPVDNPVPAVKDTVNADRATNNAAPKNDAANQLVSPINKIEAAIRDQIRQQREKQSQPPTNHEIRDLNAQESVALWTQRMGWAAGVGVFLTVVALVLLWKTTRYTRDAANYTRETVELSRETVNAANRQADAAIQIEAANLNIIGSHIFRGGMGIQEMAPPDGSVVWIEFRNIGKSHAFILSSAVCYKISATPPLLRFPIGTQKRYPPNKAVGPDRTFDIDNSAHPLSVSPEQTTAIENGELSVWAYAFVRFRDWFGIERAEYSLLRWTFDPPLPNEDARLCFVVHSTEGLIPNNDGDQPGQT